MTQFSTELLNFLAQKQDIDEFFRTSLETAMNDLLQAELSAFLGYEPYDKLGYNSGNSRNGSYARKHEGRPINKINFSAEAMFSLAEETEIGVKADAKIDIIIPQIQNIFI